MSMNTVECFGFCSVISSMTILLEVRSFPTGTVSEGGTSLSVISEGERGLVGMLANKSVQFE